MKEKFVLSPLAVKLYYKFIRALRMKSVLPHVNIQAFNYQEGIVKSTDKTRTIIIFSSFIQVAWFIIAMTSEPGISWQLNYKDTVNLKFRHLKKPELKAVVGTISVPESLLPVCGYRFLSLFLKLCPTWCCVKDLHKEEETNYTGKTMKLCAAAISVSQLKKS